MEIYSLVWIIVVVQIHIAAGVHIPKPRGFEQSRITAGQSIWASENVGSSYGGSSVRSSLQISAPPRTQDASSYDQWNAFRHASSPQTTPAPSFIIRRPLNPNYQKRVNSLPQTRTTVPRPPLDFTRQQLQRRLSNIFMPSFSFNTPTTSTTTTESPVAFANFLRILQERQTVTRNEHDMQLVTYYLLELHRIGTLGGIDSDKIMDMQIDLIESIGDILIKREVLKIFVKDMVERSGFLKKKVTASNMDALAALIDKIGLITAESGMTTATSSSFLDFLTPSDDMLETFMPAFTSVQDNNLMNSFSSFLPVPTTTSRPISRRPSFSRTQTLRRVNPLNVQRLENFAGRRRPQVGMSIFGPSPRAFQSTFFKRETTTLRPTTTTTVKRAKAAVEKLGGNSSYWTHLRAGLVDILCALCQQQGREACVKRYCNNDSLVVRQGASTPSSNATPTTRPL